MIVCPNLIDFYLARGERAGSLSVSHIYSANLLWRKQAHKGAVTSLAWSQDGQLLASGGEDGQVHIWQATSGNLLCSFEQEEKVRRLRWASNGMLAASSSTVVRIWPVVQTPAIAA